MDTHTKKLVQADLKASLNRARSVTVGTAFGGSTEISMRMNDGSTVWAIMQPVEVIELVHQLAANVGCHINLQPRNDFSSWRGWRVTEEERKHLNGHPPFANDISQHRHIGGMPVQPNLTLPAKEQENGETMAIEKTVKRRNTKRATTST
jgi:hypothetical protein